MSDSANPWVSKPDEPESAPLTPSPAILFPTGPVAPQRGVPTPDLVDQLPFIEQARSVDLWWLGTHGGAAESTLASLVPEWAAAEHGWPRVIGGGPARVVLTARSSMHGLLRAQAVATQWAAGLVPSVDLLGLVIVADAPGRLPRPLREVAQVIKGGVPRTWSIPWINSWRLGESMTPLQAPREVRHLIDELRILITSDATGIDNNRKEYQ